MSERKIVIGLITSTEYLQKVKTIWDTQLLESAAAKRLSAWCWTYFNTYNKAPGHDIEGIFLNKLKNGLDEETAQEIEEEILPELSEEFEKLEATNISYLFDLTLAYFNERKLKMLSEAIEVLLEKDKLEEALQLAKEYAPVKSGDENKPDLDLGTREALNKLEQAFEESATPVVKFPKQLGEFWNDQMVRGAFVAFLASEKRGKTWLLMEFAMRAVRQRVPVAFFQAGDMTEFQQIRRIAVYLSKKSNKAKYCGKMYEPVRDCIHQQMGKCNKPELETSWGVFEGMSENDIREITQDKLIEAYKDNDGYSPCTNCGQYADSRWGVPWLKLINVGDEPLGVNEAKRVWRKFFIHHKKDFKLSSHANGTLTVKGIELQLDLWKKEGFEPGLILVDYAELLEDDTKEFRHKQNNIWKGLRRLSQERNALVVSPTQADAESYDKNTLSLKNFSEDKRKYAHATAFYGLNQDPKGREKKIGLLRINALLMREDEFDSAKCITILQNLRRGRPFLGSYF